MDLSVLADRFWSKINEVYPTVATVRGVHEFDSSLPALDEGWIGDVAATMGSIAADAANIDETSLGLQERITRAILIHQAETVVHTFETPFLIASIDPFTGPHTRLLSDTRLNTVTDSGQAFRLLERYSKVPDFLESVLDLHRAALAQGTPPAAAALQRVMSQLDGYLASPLTDDPFLALEVADRGSEWRDRARDIVVGAVRPAVQRYRDGLSEHIAPDARPDDRCGLGWIDGGDEIYGRLSKRYTQLDLKPEEIHQLGIRWATELNAAEWAEIGEPALGIGDREELFGLLRNDPTLRFESEQQMLDHAGSSLDRAWAAVDDWFGARPDTPCSVVPVPAAVAAAMPPAYYNQPPIDGSRPGTYYINTYEPQQRKIFEYESIHFHEGIPGHHFDRSLAAELEGIPTFRRYSQMFAHTEGWGLYSERLADEMGLYTGPTDRLGMVAADAWRACRLVTDTGIHALGWSRDQAIDFMERWTPVNRLTIEQEVDRYIAMPGQALAYKIGQIEILRLREMAEKTLGSSFDIKGFHDTLLVNGAMPLPMLEIAVADWMANVD